MHVPAHACICVLSCACMCACVFVSGGEIGLQREEGGRVQSLGRGGGSDRRYMLVPCAQARACVLVCVCVRVRVFQALVLVLALVLRLCDPDCVRPNSTVAGSRVIASLL